MMEVCIKVSHANLWQKDIVYDRQGGGTFEYSMALLPNY